MSLTEVQKRDVVGNVFRDEIKFPSNLDQIRGAYKNIILKLIFKTILNNKFDVKGLGTFYSA